MRKIALFLAALSFGAVLAAGAAERVDINVANAAELASGMVGIGQSKAEAIVDYREHNGPFKSVDDLALVKGIGPATIDKNRDRIGVGAAAAAAEAPARD
ncbi:MAG: ComEA family DNA-binding protein [Gammaproteobacteria bacterium]